MTLARMRPTGRSPAGASTTATAVSSQLVSMPRTRITCLVAPAARLPESSGMAALKLGTRGSKLALTQAGLVRDALARSVPALAAPDAIEIVVIKTTGDAIQDWPLSEAGGK